MSKPSRKPLPKQPVATTSNKPKLLAAGILVGAVVLVLLVWLLTSVVFNGEDKTSAKPSNDNAPVAPATPPSGATPSDGGTTTPAPQTSGKQTPKGTVDDNRKQVLAHAILMLRQGADAKKSEASYAALLSKLQESDFSGLSKDFQGNFRFRDYFDDEGLKASSYIAVIHLAGLIDTTSEAQGNKQIEPLASSAWKNVYVDMEAGQAFVPITIFLGQQASFSLEYVYVDGEWQFTPYSLLDSIQSAERGSESAASSSSN